MQMNAQNRVSSETSSLDPLAIRAELERLLTSDQFRNSRRSQTLLTYLVEEALAGHSDQLKERLVGVHAFGRNPAYDTAVDPVVRNAAIEVRKRLARFYVDSGNVTSIRIDLPTGTYSPEFIRTVEPNPQFPSASATPPEVPSHPKPKRQVTPPAWIALAIVLLMASCLAFWVWHKQTANRLEHAPITAGGGNPTAEVSAAMNETPAGAIRILAGNTRPGGYTDRFGNQWSPDLGYIGGKVRTLAATFYYPPADAGLFRTLREGAFGYDIPLKQKQNYELRLYFCDPMFRFGNDIVGDGVNQRWFQVRANDQLLLEHFDVVADAGFASTTVRAFRDIRAADDGKLHLRFLHQQSDPILNAIELIPEDGHIIEPIRIHAGPLNYRDQAGNNWSSDNFYVGGALFDASIPAAGTLDPEMFRAERIGNFHYAIPVPPGRYTVTLYFAETWFRKPGQRIFDVTCNGQTLIRRLDIFEQAGFSRVYSKTFHGLEPDGQGKLLLAFQPEVNYASVRAVEVVSEDR